MKYKVLKAWQYTGRDGLTRHEITVGTIVEDTLVAGKPTGYVYSGENLLYTLDQLSRAQIEANPEYFQEYYEFQKGKWYKSLGGLPFKFDHMQGDTIIYSEHFYENAPHGVILLGNGQLNPPVTEKYGLVSSNEMLSKLHKESRNRGYGHGTVVKSVFSPCNRKYTLSRPGQLIIYNEEEDMLTCNQGIVLYHKGVWAEIVKPPQVGWLGDTVTLSPDFMTFTVKDVTFDVKMLVHLYQTMVHFSIKRVRMPAIAETLDISIEAVEFLILRIAEVQNGKSS